MIDRKCPCNGSECSDCLTRRAEKAEDRSDRMNERCVMYADRAEKAEAEVERLRTELRRLAICEVPVQGGGSYQKCAVCNGHWGIQFKFKQTESHKTGCLVSTSAPPEDPNAR